MEFEPLSEAKVKRRASPSPPPPKPRRRRRWARRLWRWAWLWVAALGAAGGITVAAMIHMPQVDELDDFNPGLITQLFDANGEVFKTYAVEHRMLLGEGEVPPVLQNAIIAVEDERFFDHGGIDLRGVVRAARENFQAGTIIQGASTLTMQLAENLFHTRGRSWQQKMSEALLAVEIEKRYSKQQILTMYCNLVYMGEGNYGMQAAARAYFNKPVAELSLPEAASLAGIPQRPNGYSPYRHPEALLERRNHVLRRMLLVGYIDRPAHDDAMAEPLLVAQRQRRTDHGPGPYFSEEVRRYLEPRYGSKRLYGAGLQVFTTIDPLIQETAEQAVREQLLALDHRKGWRGPVNTLPREGLDEHELPSWQDLELEPGGWYEGIVLETSSRSAEVRIADLRFTLTSAGTEWTERSRVKDLLGIGDVAWFRLERPTEGEAEWVIFLEQEPELEAVALVLESASGAVRAMVGGWDFDRSKFNRATQARRQVGSAFKPFVYGAALESGFTPADTLFDAPVAFVGASNEISYSPRNHTRRYFGILTLQRAIESSVNVISVKLLDLVGVEHIIDFARRCGIESDLPPYPSLALGAADLAPLEVAAAYATFANHGIHVQPHVVEKVTTPAGRILEEYLPRAHKAVEPDVAYVLSHMLEGVVDRGSGAPLNRLEVDLAGKTGTTNAYSDAWFVGYTPKHTLLTWVGYNVKRSIGRGMTGMVAALPIWKKMAEAGLEAGWIETGDRFTTPAGITLVPVEQRTGLRPPPEGGVVVVETAFLAGTEPTLTYDADHWSPIIGLPWYQQQPFYLPKEGENMPADVDGETWAAILESWEAKDEAVEESETGGP